MIYTIKDTNDLLEKIEKYHESTLDDCGYFLIRAVADGNNVIRLAETFSLSSHINTLNDNSIFFKTDFIESKLIEFEKSKSLFTIAYINKNSVKCKNQNKPYNFSIIYKIMQKGNRCKYTNPYLLINLLNTGPEANLFYENNIYKGIQFVHNEWSTSIHDNSDLCFGMIL